MVHDGQILEGIAQSGVFILLIVVDSLHSGTFACFGKLGIGIDSIGDRVGGGSLWVVRRQVYGNLR